MVDLVGQYHQIKQEIDQAVINTIESAQFINGPEVKLFAQQLAAWVGTKHIIPCANGTDALQIALMALGLKPGDEVIVPAFTYVATAEVIALLHLTPVMVDVDLNTFNIAVHEIEAAITPRTKAIVPVHLFGQSSDMEPIMQIAQKHNLYVIEDNAQSLGAQYTFSNGETKQTGTIGHIGCTSFFPTKNLGCFGDGGAIYTDDDALAEKIYMIANHGQKIKYHHSVVGCNSRLDTLQAAILNVKLHYLDQHLNARKAAAAFYDKELKNWQAGQIPFRMHQSTHTFNQYTLLINNGRRDELKAFLSEKGIPTMIYYPLPLYKQEAFKSYAPESLMLTNTEKLCGSVLSIPIHTEMTGDILTQITEAIQSFR